MSTDSQDNMPPPLPGPWVKAKASNPSGNCVIVRRNGELIEVGDDKFPDAKPLGFTIAEFEAFADGVRNGEFDALL